MSSAYPHDEPHVAEAAEWCARLADGLDLEGQLAFEAWLVADPLNRPAFEQMGTLWRDVPKLANSPDLIGVRADALAAMRGTRRQRWALRFTARWRGLAAAAACLLLILLGSVYYLQPRPEIYATGIGERRVLTLADGSRISLDAASRVEVAFSDERRSLRVLAGRAKFDVAQDPRRPFSVAAGTRLVVATGTAFSVELVNRELRVILYEGKVAVLEASPDNLPPRHVRLDARPGPADQALLPGKTLVARLDRPVATIETVDVARSLAWEGGQLTFADEPLALAAARVNRHSGIQIVIAPSAAEIPVSGAFNAGDVEGFVDGIRALYALNVSRQGGAITLSAPASQD